MAQADLNMLRNDKFAIQSPTQSKSTLSMHRLAKLLGDTTRKMIYYNTWDPLLVSAGNSSRYQ
jgi:hypothetical protein